MRPVHIAAPPQPMPVCRRHDRAAFTLIELIAAMATVAILSLIVITAIGYAKSSASRAQCISNLRQIGIAVSLYAADHNDSLPPLMDPEGTGQTGQKASWAFAIWNYAGYRDSDFRWPENDLMGGRGEDRNIFHCPVTRWQKIVRVPTATLSTGNHISYSMNYQPYAIAFGAGDRDTHPLPRNAIQNPSEAMMVFENEAGHSGGSWDYFVGWGLMPHEGRTHFLFHDLHVEAREPSAVPRSLAASPVGFKRFWQGQ